METLIRTLLTGFGPFQTVVNNPSERLARHFQSAQSPGHRITTRILRVSYEGAPGALADAIRTGDTDGRPFDVVWMLGVAAGSTAWRIERYGENATTRAADMDGRMPGDVIVPGGPQHIEATAPTEAIRSAIWAAGLPAVISESAGTYLCNFAMYSVLHYLHDTGSHARAGFLHIPADPLTMHADHPPTAHFSFDDHILAVVSALSAFIT